MAMLVRVERGMGDLSKDGEGRFREPQNRIELLCVCGGGGSSATSLACFHRIRVGEYKNKKMMNSLCLGRDEGCWRGGLI